MHVFKANTRINIHNSYYNISRCILSAKSDIHCRFDLSAKLLHIVSVNACAFLLRTILCRSVFADRYIVPCKNCSYIIHCVSTSFCIISPHCQLLQSLCQENTWNKLHPFPHIRSPMTAIWTKSKKNLCTCKGFCHPSAPTHAGIFLVDLACGFESSMSQRAGRKT